MEILHHDFIKKSFHKHMVSRNLGVFSMLRDFMKILFALFPENGVMQLEFIVIVTIINLLRRLKTSNENHKFSSEESRARFFFPPISGWIEMIYFHLIINLSFSLRDFAFFLR